MPPKKGFTHESTKNVTKEWYTPPSIFQALGVTFDLDPCSPVAGPLDWIPVRNRLTEEDDGLFCRWEGNVWMNPPYGSDTIRWLKRLAQHGQGIALVFARTDTEWFHEYCTQAHAIVFMRGRVRFITPGGDPGGTPGSGSMLLAFGEENSRTLERSGLGLYLKLR